VEVTGDDAIELAHARARAELGSDIGVCLRVAGYSQVSRATSDMVASALQDAARALGVGLVPLVIAEYRSQDRRATLPLVRDFPDARPPLRRYARPEDVIDQVGECRVVVTGAYHAAVFALSQGIPVVGLSASTYYDDKLLGLFDMFGGALQLVDLREGAPEQDLAAATRDAWHRAASLRPALLRHAAVQVEASRHAFDRACEL
jgi:polysaccharide pyruvyl transferase WcaK-like protein